MELRFLAALTAFLLGGAVFAQAMPGKTEADDVACRAVHTAAVQRIQGALQASGLPYAAGMYNTSGCDVTAISGTGTVSPEEVKTALAKAGIDVEVGPNLPAPVFGLSQGRLKTKLPALIRVSHGQNLRIETRWFNPTNKAQVLDRSAASLNYVVLDSQLRPVRWKESNMVINVEFLSDCPARAFCKSWYGLDIPLNHFNPALPLEPERYFLRLRAAGFGFAGQTWSDTYPDIPLEILP